MSERVCACYRIYQSVWSCQKVSYLQIGDMRTQPRSSLRKTGFVYLFCLHLVFVSRSVSRFFPPFLLWLCTLMLFFLRFFSKCYIQIHECYIANVSLCFFFFHFSSIFLHLFDLQTDRDHNINSPNAIRVVVCYFFLLLLLLLLLPPMLLLCTILFGFRFNHIFFCCNLHIILKFANFFLSALWGEFYHFIFEPPLPSSLCFRYVHFYNIEMMRPHVVNHLLNVTKKAKRKRHLFWGAVPQAISAKHMCDE